MGVDQGLIDWVAEALEPLGVVTSRRMMGAAVVYCDGVIFAVAEDSELFFKSDDESAAVWNAAGCGPWTFEMKGETVVTNYRAAPADVYDDADAMSEWAQIALAAGLRSAAKKRPRSKKA